MVFKGEYYKSRNQMVNKQTYLLKLRKYHTKMNFKV